LIVVHAVTSKSVLVLVPWLERREQLQYTFVASENVLAEPRLILNTRYPRHPICVLPPVGATRSIVLK